MIPGTLTWNDVGNNQAYQSGAIGMTFNGVSLYYSMLKIARCEGERDGRRYLARRSRHGGESKRKPMSAAPISAMLFKHSKYPNAAKEYLRFMMEADQYGLWLSSCLGYWCQPLKAYSQDEVLEQRTRS